MMLDELEEKVLEFINSQGMVSAGDQMVTGISGGPDSVCLLLVLNRLFPGRVHAVHVNHMIRGESAFKDEKFVKDLCERLGVDLVVRRYDIPAMSEKSGRSLEEEGRLARYRAFDERAAEFQRVRTALAHHMDDQAETMLFRMARGTGIRGLAAMKPVRDGKYIRPLLCVTKAQILDYLKRMNQDYCLDATNEDVSYGRNRIRHRILPELEKVNARAADHLCSLSRDCSEISSYLDEIMDGIAERLISHRGDALIMSSAEFLKLKPLEQMEVMYRFICRACGRKKDISRVHVQAAVDMVSSHGLRIDLPYSLRMYQSGDEIGIYRSGDEEKRPAGRILFERKPFKKTDKIPDSAYTKAVDYDRIKGVPCVRTRRDGDRFVYDRQGHEKSIARFMIDEHVPEYMRDRIPLAADDSGIIWIPGYRLSPAYYVTEDTKEILLLTFEQGEDK